MTNLFLESQHDGSGRFAIVEDDGESAWLYLTKAREQVPVADVWVYNRNAPPTVDEIRQFSGGPPPAAVGYVSDHATVADPLSHAWTFRWAADGRSVALCCDGVPIACILDANGPGYSRNLIAAGPWGRPWSQPAFDSRF